MIYLFDNFILMLFNELMLNGCH